MEITTRIIRNWADEKGVPDLILAELDYYAFLGELDDRDYLFLDMAKYLLHKPYPKASEEVIEGIKYPLAWLMEGLPISDEAAVMTQEDIGIYLPEATE